MGAGHMFIDYMMDVFELNKYKDAIVWRDKVYNYEWLLDRIRYWQERTKSEDIKAGTITILEADFSPNSVALFLALIERACILVPLTSSVEANKPEFIEIAQGEISFSIDENDNVRITKLPNSARHELYYRLRRLNHPGLLLFSSGSTGRNKGSVHDVTRLLEKYKARRRNLRTLTFLLFDHIGGIDTLFYALSNGSCLITVDNRSPDTIGGAIEAYAVEVLPVTPTFLNLLILSEAYTRYDLSTLKYITYGTEVMPEVTLKRCVEYFPNVSFLQKYGTTEVGTLRSKSKSSDSLWVKIGGEGFESRIVNGVLQIKAKSTMLGYLNAPGPFTADGWFNTGDSVEVDGEYIRILGRKSEIINIGGEKVYPAEVESVIQKIDNVKEVTVYGEKNAITGNIVCAKVSLSNSNGEDQRAFALRLKKYCREKLQNYKVPVRVQVTNEKQHSARFKKTRAI